MDRSGFGPEAFPTRHECPASVAGVVEQEVRMSALAVSPAVYEPPALGWRGEVATEQPWLVFAVWVFTLSAALAWAAYCIHQGGNPDIDIGWFRIKVSCYKN
jgi:hypothetical protein